MAYEVCMPGYGTLKSHLCMKPRFNPDLTFV